MSVHAVLAALAEREARMSPCFVLCKVAYGCARVIFKMDKSGEAMEYRHATAARCLLTRRDAYSLHRLARGGMGSGR